jgi:hypothetical protein
MKQPGGMLKYLATIVATAIVVLFLLVSAIPLMHWFSAEGRIAELQENRAIWDDLGLRDYRYAIEMSCDCTAPTDRPVRVRVADGRVTELVDLTSGEALSPAAFADLPLDMPALFSFVEQGLVSDADELSVRYDEIYGFPREFRADPDSEASGDETEIRVSEFDPRPESGGL